MHDIGPAAPAPKSPSLRRVAPAPAVSDEPEVPLQVRAAEEFLAWCSSAGVPSINAVQPVHVATWIEAGTRELAAPGVKQRLAAIRHLFDWLVTGQVVPVNPAGSVRGPRHVVTSGQTPVLDPIEARALLDSIDGRSLIKLRQVALLICESEKESREMTEQPTGPWTRTSRVIKARPEELYAAFLDPAALVDWLPPAEMTGEIHEFDARVGGGYRMSMRVS